MLIQKVIDTLIKTSRSFFLYPVSQADHVPQNCWWNRSLLNNIVTFETPTNEKWSYYSRWFVITPGSKENSWKSQNKNTNQQVHSFSCWMIVPLKTWLKKSLKSLLKKCRAALRRAKIHHGFSVGSFFSIIKTEVKHVINWPEKRSQKGTSLDTNPPEILLHPWWENFTPNESPRSQVKPGKKCCETIQKPDAKKRVSRNGKNVRMAS